MSDETLRLFHRYIAPLVEFNRTSLGSKDLVFVYQYDGDVKVWVIDQLIEKFSRGLDRHETIQKLRAFKGDSGRIPVYFIRGEYADLESFPYIPVPLYEPLIRDMLSHFTDSSEPVVTITRDEIGCLTALVADKKLVLEKLEEAGKTLLIKELKRVNWGIPVVCINLNGDGKAMVWSV